jgi:plasmid stabilization system protein ParE
VEKIVWSKVSSLSLKEIWEFYAEKSVSAADKIIQEIISAAENISFKDQYQIEEIL